ncbi:MAG TPA: hypothetical protein VJV79_04900 [Polyangiaceae bacterium]|nr:hypothetical protein [Polyangiaceae bacterium]
MNTRYVLAAAALLTSFAIEPGAQAQGAPTAAAAAARRQKLAAQQAAAIASAKAAAAAAPTTTPPPVATINRPAATATPTAAATTTPTAAATTTPTATATPTAAASVAPPKATASAAPATSGSAAPAPAAAPNTPAIALDIEALRKTRPDRRHAEFVNLQSRWGNLLNDPRIADELKLHSQRLAYLQRIRALGAKDPAFVKSVDALITKEETRNSDALNALRSGALPAAAAPAAGATK